MSFSKSKARKSAEGPSRLRQLIQRLTNLWGGALPPKLLEGLKREARKRIAVEPRRKIPRKSRFFQHSPQPRRRPAKHQPSNSIDPKWTQGRAFPIRERLGLPQNTPWGEVQEAIRARS